MSEDEVQVLLSSIHGLWDKALSDDQIDAWKMSMARWDCDVMMEALGRWSEVEPSFAPRPLELVALARTIATERRAASPENRCDGSGWVNDAVLGLHPCSSCNPYLWGVYGEHDRWLAWLGGTRLDQLHPDVRWNGRERTCVVDLMPLACTTDDPPCSHEHGVAIASANYQAERARMNAPINEAYFSQRVRVATVERVKPIDPSEPRPRDEDDDDF